MEPFYREFIKREAVTGMILDVDGTLLDSMPVWHHSGEHYLATIGIQAPASLGRILFSMTMQQGAQYIRKTYRLSQSEEEIKAGIIKTVQHEYSTGPGMKPGAREFLQALKEAAIPIYPFRKVFLRRAAVEPLPGKPCTAARLHRQIVSAPADPAAAGRAERNHRNPVKTLAFHKSAHNARSLSPTILHVQIDTNISWVLSFLHLPQMP